MPSRFPQVDPGEGLTFSVHTHSASERSSKATVRLPYEHTQARKDSYLSTAGGRIFYEPDRNDDYDSDDPDDDLDI